MNLLVADDHHIVRHGIIMLLESLEDYHVVGEASTTEETIKKARELRPDILLLDISTPKTANGCILKTIEAEKISTHCIVLSNRDDDENIVQAIKMGARAYIFKSCQPRELLLAINTVHAGDMYFTQRVSNAMARSITSHRKWVQLTKTENEVLQLIAQGLSSKMVADQLSSSIRTVETHRYRIMKKLNAANSAEMVKIAFQRRMVKP